MRGLALLLMLAASLGCNNKKLESGVAPPKPISQEAPPLPPPPEVLALYAEAAELDPLRLRILASSEGLGSLLREAEREPNHRRTVVAALPYTGRLAAVEYLAKVVEASESERDLALASLSELLGEVNRNEDLEDVLELQRGCGQLIQFAQASRGSSAQRAYASSIVAQLSDFGCKAP